MHAVALHAQDRERLRLAEAWLRSGTSHGDGSKPIFSSAMHGRGKGIKNVHYFPPTPLAFNGAFKIIVVPFQNRRYFFVELALGLHRCFLHSTLCSQMGKPP